MSKLYIIPTPIGNLEDISLRALRLLKEVDLIFSEDTRTTGKLLEHFQIDNKLKAYHIHNEHQQLQYYLQLIQQNTAVALTSDAGTPCISDPGFLLVRACIENEIEVECLPGATALIPALVNSGLSCDKFCFYGFVPHKKGRETLFKHIAESDVTSIIYESPHRLIKTLTLMQGILGDGRPISISRELTKIYEENFRGNIAECLAHFNEKEIKGEFVICIEKNDDKKIKNDED